MKNLMLVAFAMLVVGAATGAYADPIQSWTPTLSGGILADFEGFGEGTLIGGGVYPGVTFGQDDGGTPMIDNYGWLYGYGASSGSGVLTGSTTGGAPFPTVAGITATFATPVSAVEFFFSDTAPLGVYTISAFGMGGVLLESIVIGDQAGEFLPPGYVGGSFPPPGTFPLPGVYVGFTSAAGGIYSIQAGPSDAYGDAFAIDDLRFQPIPEPTSVLLLGTGLGALGLIVYRRRK